MRQEFVCQIRIEFLDIYKINIQTSTFRVFVRQSKDVSDVVTIKKLIPLGRCVVFHVVSGMVSVRYLGF
uniref:Uncharacterized protein n=1 Tax=Candidatus Methanogaster sp. ANME-2c ERB4 TaxID=2759911 RepID=A0A7G9YRL5_9EURY|nr:hypothetical protein FICJDHNH_00034 [Methanosarcinales archaeon ANME-2c ERB4]QNO43951.1 hypothetical protein AECFJODE_00004 [Methanosarcinales archaeon ANME-2c ERB4]QNO50649.1 hypothetical protein BCJHFGCD_00003 [Methanosarcinales archaeon ANME-2c ERB4]